MCQLATSPNACAVGPQVLDPLVGLQHAVKVMDFLGLLICKKQADRRKAAEALVQPPPLEDASEGADSMPLGASPGAAISGAAAGAAAAAAAAAAGATGAAATADTGASTGSWGDGSGVSGAATPGMTQAAGTSRGAGNDHAGPATSSSRRAGEGEGLSGHGAGPSRFRPGPDRAERRTRARTISEENVEGFDEMGLETEEGSAQGTEVSWLGDGEEDSESRAAEPKDHLRKVSSTGRHDRQQADRVRQLKGTGKRPVRSVAQSGPLASRMHWEEEDEGSGRSSRAGKHGGTSRTTSVGRAAGALFKDGGASYASDWSEGGDSQKRRGQKTQEPEREAGHASDVETLPRAQSLGPLKRFHALRVKLGGEKGVVGEPELAEDWAVPMSPLDAELLRASGVTPLRTLSVVAEQQRASAAQSTGAIPLTPSAPSAASTPKGTDKARKGGKKGAFDLVSPREEFGIGPPWVNYLQDRPSSDRRSRAEKEREERPPSERPSSERKGRAAAQEVDLDVRPSSEKKARAVAEGKTGRSRLEKTAPERRRSGEGEGGQGRGAEEGTYRRGSSLQRDSGEPQSVTGGSEDWGRGGLAHLAEPESELESKQRSRPSSQLEPRARRASNLRQLLQTEQSLLQQQQLQSQWDALSLGGTEDACEVVMVEEEAPIERKGRRGRGPGESMSHDFTSLASDPSGSVSVEAEARRDEDAPDEGHGAGEGEPSRPQGKHRVGLERKWASHAERHGSDALLSPVHPGGGEDSEGEGTSVSSLVAEEPVQGKPRKKGKPKAVSKGTVVGSSDPLLNADNPPVVRSASERKMRQQGIGGSQAESSRPRGKGVEKPGGAPSAAERLSQHVLSALYGSSSEQPSGDRKGKQPERQVSSERRARPRGPISDMALSLGFSGLGATASGGGAHEAPALATPRRPASDRKAREGREDAAGDAEGRKQGKGAMERAASSRDREAPAESGGGLRKANTERRGKGGEVSGSGEKRGAAKGAPERKPRRSAASVLETGGEGQPPSRRSGDPSGEDREPGEAKEGPSRSTSSSRWRVGGVLEGVMTSSKGAH